MGLCCVVFYLYASVCLFVCLFVCLSVFVTDPNGDGPDMSNGDLSPVKRTSFLKKLGYNY